MAAKEQKRTSHEAVGKLYNRMNKPYNEYHGQSKRYK